MNGSLEQKRKRGKMAKTAMFFTPALLLLLVFFIGPMFMTMLFSFTDLTLTGSAANATNFVGFQNFAEIFKEPKIGKIIRNTLVFLVVSGIIGQQIFGFVVAMLMHKRNKVARRFAGFAIVCGWITPEIIAAYMFVALFADKGSLNRVISTFGASPVSWLFTFPMVCVVVANIWKGCAYSMMMFQASLDSISDDVLEAADIDGANFWQRLTRIIIPMLKSTFGTTFIIVTLSTLGAFGLIFAMTGGGPGVETTTLSIYMYQRAFSAYQVGYGMAIALIILLIGVVFSLAYTALINRERGNK